MIKRLLFFSLLFAACDSDRGRPSSPPAQNDSGVPADAAGGAADASTADAGQVDAATADAGGQIGQIPVARCPAATLTALPLDVHGDTTTAASEFEASCAGAGNSPDVAIVWTAPSAGLYFFTTSGSAYDTVLTVLDGACGGTELVCQDDIGPTIVQSETALTLTAGQVVTIIVDGLDVNEKGTFDLRVDPD